MWILCAMYIQCFNCCRDNKDANCMIFVLAKDFLRATLFTSAS